MSDLKHFSDRLLSKFSQELTDKVFLLIQEDKDLMTEYLDLIHQYGRKTVNPFIGKEVKTRFGLENQESRGESPQSNLIASFQELKLKQ